jgi:DNA polymerase-3 subunit alpha
MAALMTFEMGDTDKTLKNISECREGGIEVLPPDLNNGQVGFNVVQSRILFGLAAIKGIGQKAVEKIIETRTAGGPFKNLHDFCVRVDPSLLNRRSMENFIKAGAFDWTQSPRAEMMEFLDDTIKRAQKEREKSLSNQIDLFGSLAGAEEEVRPKNGKRVVEWPVTIKLAHEKDALGFYLSGHPLEKFRQEFSRLGTVTIRDVQKASDGANVTVAGVMTLLKLKNTKKGERYATFVLEDMLDTIEVIVWPDTYQKVQQALTAEDPVIVSARLDVSDERRTLIAAGIESAIVRRDRSATEALIFLDRPRCSTDKLEELKSVLGEHKGQCPVKLIFRNPDHSETTIALPASWKVAPSETLSNRVEQLFGEPVVTFR